MKWIVPLALILPVFLSLTGCFQVDTVIRLNPDGTGTIEETVLMSKKFLAEMNGLMQGFAGKEGKQGKGKPQAADLYDPVQLRAKAARLGEGVSYLSGKRLEDKEFRGYRAVYSFSDINKLTLDRNPGKKISDSAATIDDGKMREKESVMMHFSKGPPATLAIRRQSEKSTEKPKQSDIYEEPVSESFPKADADAEKFLKMLEGMRLAMAIEINGNILQTNATYRNGSRITVMDLDFGKLLGKPEQLSGLRALRMQSVEEAKELLKDIPGMKVDLNDELKVTFEQHGGS